MNSPHLKKCVGIVAKGVRGRLKSGRISVLL